MSPKIATKKVKDEIFTELEKAPEKTLKEVLDFIYFLKVKRAIDPSQAYFWSKTWQAREREANEDRKAGRVIGNGTVKELLKVLKT